MGKGRKALKKSTEEDLDKYLVNRAAEERHGGAVDSSEPMFFVDKSRDGSLGKKTHERRKKVLRCDSILQRSSLMPAVPHSKKRLKKSGDKDLAKAAAQTTLAVRVPAARKQEKIVYDIWSSGEVVSRKRKTCNVFAPAVEVDAPGCSYNPTFDDHQEALGLAVAQEMRKIYKKELAAKPIPRTVTGLEVSEEEALFLEAAVGEDEEESEDESLALPAGPRSLKLNKLTRVDLNKKKKRREALKLEAEKQHRSKTRKDIARLPDLLEELGEENVDKERRRIRRLVSREERKAQGPPSLGGHRFVPEPVQVLTTDEVTGSLRKLKACYTLARERMKSWQRRGILEPRAPQKRRKTRS